MKLRGLTDRLFGSNEVQNEVEALKSKQESELSFANSLGFIDLQENDCINTLISIINRELDASNEKDPLFMEWNKMSRRLSIVLDLFSNGAPDLMPELNRPVAKNILSQFREKYPLPPLTDILNQSSYAQIITHIEKRAATFGIVTNLKHMADSLSGLQENQFTEVLRQKIEHAQISEFRFISEISDAVCATAESLHNLEKVANMKGSEEIMMSAVNYALTNLPDPLIFNENLHRKLAALELTFCDFKESLLSEQKLNKDAYAEYFGALNEHIIN